MRSTAVLFIGLMALMPTIHAINFRLDANEEFCFHEMTHKGNKVLAFYEVLSWGYGSYVTLRVTSPAKREIYNNKASAEGKVDFVASEDGEFNFCFSGARGGKTDLKFWVNTEIDFGLNDVVKEDHMTDMSYSVERLGSLVNAARTDLDAFRSREAKHRQMAIKNGKRVTFWAIAECVLIFVVAFAQIFRLQKFMENRRSV